MKRSPLLSLVVPLYNEEKNIPVLVPSLVSAFEKSRIPYELVLVNNGSWDHTRHLILDFARKNTHIHPVHVPKNQGYGYGVLQGLHASKGDYVGYIDGDNQISVDAIVAAHHLMAKEGFDVVKGVRKKRQIGFLRIIASECYNLLFRLLFFLPYREINSKPKIMKKEVFDHLRLESKDWFIDTEILIKARRFGYTVGEVHYFDKKRLGGKSSVRFAVVFEFLGNLFRYRFLR